MLPDWLPLAHKDGWLPRHRQKLSELEQKILACRRSSYIKAWYIPVDRRTPLKTTVGRTEKSYRNGRGDAYKINTVSNGLSSFFVTVTGQTKDVLTKIEGLLKEAGTDKSHLLTAQIWLKDIDTDFAAMNTVWSQWLDPANKPVRATIQAPMARPTILVEIQVTAAATGEKHAV